MSAEIQIADRLRKVKQLNFLKIRDSSSVADFSNTPYGDLLLTTDGLPSKVVLAFAQDYSSYASQMVSLAQLDADGGILQVIPGEETGTIQEVNMIMLASKLEHNDARNERIYIGYRI